MDLSVVMVGKITRRLVQPYYDYKYRKNSDDYKKLKELPKLNGEIGFLIGNGPSVRIKDLEKLKNYQTFCCNRFHLAYPTTSFRPTFTFSSDRQVIEDFGQEIVSESEGHVILVHPVKPPLENHIWVPLVFRRRLTFRETKLSRVTPNGGTLFTAIQVGYFLGIRKFVLYGVDHDFKFEKAENEMDNSRSAIGDENHFIKGYRSGQKWCPPAMKLIEDSFIYADRYLRKKGGFLVNATHGGKLDILERIDFSDALML